jgi:mono/diheme cytochrome c family protein
VEQGLRGGERILIENDKQQRRYFSSAESFAKSGRALAPGARFISPLLSCIAIVVVLLIPATSQADPGSDTFKARCSACHGHKGAADTMLGKNLNLRPLSSLEVQEQSDDQLFAIISRGRKKMPAFDRKLSPDQIRDLVKHIRSFKK